MAEVFERALSCTLCEGLPLDRHGLAGHGLADAQRAQVRAALDEATKVAIGEDAEEALRAVDDGRAPETLATHLDDGVRERFVGCVAWERVP